MPPPPRRRRTKKSPETADSQEPVTPVTPVTSDTPPDGGGEGPSLEEAMAQTQAAMGGGEPRPRARGGAGSAPARPRPRTKADRLQVNLEEFLSAPALIYAAAGDEWAANFVSKRAPVMAEAWVNLAQENPAVRRVLERLTTGSAWGGVIIATGGTILPLLTHHNLLPDLGLPLGRGEAGAPIVPPPPTTAGGGTPPPPPRSAPSGSGVGRPPPPPGGFTDMTPPLKDGQPPGVVTVAGSTNAAAG